MINKMGGKKLVLALCFNFVLFNFISAQFDGQYKYLPFIEFIEQKIDNHSEFIKDIYSIVGSYPEHAKLYNVEGDVEVFVFFHHNGEPIDIILSGALYFNPSQDRLRKAFEKNISDRTDKFFTRFKVSYDTDPFRVNRRDYHKTYKGLIKENTFVVLNYSNPKIKSQY